MFRTIEVNVDQSTWPSSGLPAFPAAFSAGASTASINVLAMLLLVGHLTTPVVATGVSLSEFWAWVRYAYAIAETDDLRITREFADLDAHQKTILSDDFGMGLPMYWLTETLDIGLCCDGRYFMDRFPALAGVTAIGPKKRGPTKSPDFVALDQSGKFHVIECKGTQSGETYRARQMAQMLPSGAASGATVQKRVINVPAAYRGQNLACGLVIGVQDSSNASSLLVQDPEPDTKLTFSEGEVELAKDPLLRAVLARITRAAGLQITAQLLATPSGAMPWSRKVEGQFPQRREALRQAQIGQRRALARAEISRALNATASVARDGLLARSIDLDLPRELIIDGASYRRVSIRQGIRPHLAEMLAGDALEDGSLLHLAPELSSATGKMKLRGDGPWASLEIGDVFVAEMQFF